MIRNLSRDTVVARHPWLAHSLYWRMRGMLGRRFTGFDAMVFAPCSAIHMIGMHMPLDVLFLDAQGRVLGLRARLRPWRLASHRGARITVELPVGAIAASATAVGDALHLGDLPRGGTAYSD